MNRSIEHFIRTRLIAGRPTIEEMNEGRLPVATGWYLRKGFMADIRGIARRPLLHSGSDLCFVGRSETYSELCPA